MLSSAVADSKYKNMKIDRSKLKKSSSEVVSDLILCFKPFIFEFDTNDRSSY